VRLYKRGGVFSVTDAEHAAGELSDALPPAAVSEARASINLELVQSELGQYTLMGSSGYSAAVSQGAPPNIIQGASVSLAVGNSHLALQPQNGAANARLAHDPDLARRVTLQP
jgi:hypothetical protein